METILKDNNYIIVAEGVKPDYKKRVVLPAILVQKGVTYHIYHNRMGQIILDPQVTIPASELWLFENKKILAMIDKGMAEKRLINRGSFAKYVKDASGVKV